MNAHPNQGFQYQLRTKIDQKTKPLGALGMLEEVAFRIGCMQQSLEPTINDPHIVVFAGDHGIAATGLVNPYPQEVTAQMVKTFLDGGAAINVFCRLNNIQLLVVDAGVNCNWDSDISTDNFIQAKIAKGTVNFLHAPAMTEQQAQGAIEQGKKIVNKISEKGCNTIGIGEMGIGNTSSAALIMSAVTNLPIDNCVGRGTGNEKQRSDKLATLKVVQALHQHNIQNNKDPITILQHFGGFEIAMMIGAYLEAKHKNMIIVVDGFISSAALLLATLADPSIPHNCVFAHLSDEKGHKEMLECFAAKPILNLGLRLGEGTGAALAIPLIKAAVAFLKEMASFESAAVAEPKLHVGDQTSKSVC